jgi:hypothetical protein
MASADENTPNHGVAALLLGLQEPPKIITLLYGVARRG